MKGRLLCGVLLLLSITGFAQDRSMRPNIILIVADDLGFSDLGCYGGEIETPHLDRLASEGLRFTQFYNSAVCVTTRAGLYTGLYPRFGKGGLLRPEMTTLGSVLQKAGYRTAMTGKWHLGDRAPKRPVDRGFEEYYGLLSGCSSFFNPAKPDPVFYNGGKVRPFAHNDRAITEFPEDYYATDAFTDHAIETVKRFAESDDPFFINLNYTAPHFPLHALPEDIEKYRGKYRDGYEALRKSRYQRLFELGIFTDRETVLLSEVDRKNSDFRYDYEVVPWEKLDESTRAREEARMEVYAAMVDRLDQGIGRLLAALEESGEAGNTIVFFFSDNGGCASWPTGAREPGFFEYNRDIPVGDPRGYEFVGKAWGWAQNSPFRRHKVWSFEGGICTPMIVRWPGRIKSGSITRQPGHVIDFMPTLMELAGADYPESSPPIEGRSLVPILRGEQREQPEFLAWSLYGNHAWREGDWKIVWDTSIDRWLLFDLESDRSETRDLAKVHPDRVKEMAKRWNDWAVKCGVKPAEEKKE